MSNKLDFRDIDIMSDEEIEPSAPEYHELVQDVDVPRRSIMNDHVPSLPNNPEMPQTEPVNMSSDVPLDNVLSDSEDEWCVICNEEYKDTYLFPCHHRTVCHSCSDQLEEDITINKDTCVYCRTPIKFVFYLDGSEKILDKTNN